MTKDEDDRARFVARGSRVIDTESEWGSFEIIQCASGDNASRAGSVAEALNAAADRLEGVEIGPMPPMEGDGKADERLMKAYQVQQTGVPDQTALVWRTDLLDHFHRFWTLQGRAAVAATPSPVVGDREAIAIPIPMVLHCPKCGLQHVDEPSEGWDNPPHRSHLCHGCGCVWRPADIATCGVASVSTQGSADNWTADAILSLSTPVVGGGADSLVDAATGGRFSNLTAFTEAMLSADDERSLDELVGEAATLLHALAGSLPDPHTMDRAGMVQEVE